MTTPVREYELALLLSPSLSESDAEGFVQSFISGLLADAKAEVTFQDFWGRKRLAYPIQKEESAYYVILRFTCDGSNLVKLDEEIRIEGKILRHLLTVVEKGDIAMTLAEIEAWNTENLPKKKKNTTAEPKRAPLKRKSVAKKSAADTHASKELDKKQLDKQLDEILDADI